MAESRRNRIEAVLRQSAEALSAARIAYRAKCTMAEARVTLASTVGVRCLQVEGTTMYFIPAPVDLRHLWPHVKPAPRGHWRVTPLPIGEVVMREVMEDGE